MTPSTRPRDLIAAGLFLVAAAFYGRSLYAQGHTHSLASATPVPVVIHELLPHTDPPQVDAVELFNPFGTQAEIGGWCLSDDKDEPCRYRFPEGTTIAPNGFLVVTADQWNEGPGPNWGLSELGEVLYLSQALPGQAPAGYEDRARFGANANGVSLGRIVTSDGREFFPPMRSVTLGAPNDLPSVGPVVIAEIMYHTADASLPEYLEILNTGPTSIPLYDPLAPANRWRVEGVGGLEENSSDSQLPANLELAPGESLYLTDAAPDDFRSAWNLPPETVVVRYWGKLKDDGDEVALLRPDTPNTDGFVPYLVVDEADYVDSFPWPTEAAGQGPGLQRKTLDGYGQEPAHWQAAQVGLDDPASLSVLSFTDLPQPGAGRLITWQTSWEWRGSTFRILRSATPNLADAQQVSGDIPAQGNRHMGHAYAITDPDADLSASWRYWLLWVSESGESTVAEHAAGPWRAALLPLVRND